MKRVFDYLFTTNLCGFQPKHPLKYGILVNFAYLLHISHANFAY